jgi:hypothetical protein
MRTTICLNKIDAARRQLDAAIRMTFRQEDPVAIHCLTAAGGQRCLLIGGLQT